MVMDGYITSFRSKFHILNYIFHISPGPHERRYTVNTYTLPHVYGYRRFGRSHLGNFFFSQMTLPNERTFLPKRHRAFLELYALKRCNNVSWRGHATMLPFKTN